MVLDEYRDGVKFSRLREITFPSPGSLNLDFDSQTFGSYSTGGEFDLSFNTNQLAQNSILKLSIAVELGDSSYPNNSTYVIESIDINSANSVCVYDPPAPPVLYVR